MNVSASHLASGSKTITSNGNNIDVTGLKSVNVDVLQNISFEIYRNTAKKNISKATSVDFKMDGNYLVITPYTEA